MKTSDFSEDLVHIQRSEVKHYDKLPDGIVRNGYEIVSHGKTPDADRKLFLTQNAKTFLAMIMKAKEQRNFHSEYLLLDKNGERMKNDAIRKTCISNMGESGALTNEEIRFLQDIKIFRQQKNIICIPQLPLKIVLKLMKRL